MKVSQERIDSKIQGRKNYGGSMKDSFKSQEKLMEVEYP